MVVDSLCNMCIFCTYTRLQNTHQVLAVILYQIHIAQFFRFVCTKQQIQDTPNNPASLNSSSSSAEDMPYNMHRQKCTNKSAQIRKSKTFPFHATSSPTKNFFLIHHHLDRMLCAKWSA